MWRWVGQPIDSSAYQRLNDEDNEGGQVSTELVIVDEVVQSCLTAGRRSLSMLQSSDSFAESMADAAGCNGPLRNTLKDAEDKWQLRREKMIATLQELIQLIDDLNQAYEDMESGMAESLSGGASGDEPATSADGGAGCAPGGGAAGGQSAPDQPPSAVAVAPGGPPAAEPALAAPSSLPASSTTDPSEPPVTVVDPVVPRPPSAPVTTPLQLVHDFAQRWADLTGRPVAEVLTLLTAGMGITALLALAGGVGVLANGGKVTSGPGGTSSALPGATPTTGPTADQQPVPDPDQRSSTPAEQPAADDPSAEVIDQVQVGDPDLIVDEDAWSWQDDSSLPDDALVGPSLEQPAESVPASDTASEPPADLRPDPAMPVDDRPAHLPDLTALPGDSVDAGSSGGAVAAQAAPLPSLSPLDSGPSPDGSRVAAELPDLAADPSSPSVAAPGAVAPAELPDLTDDSPADRNGGRPMMPMAMGAGGGVASTSGNGDSARVSSAAAAQDRAVSRRDARLVLGESEELG